MINPSTIQHHDGNFVVFVNGEHRVIKLNPINGINKSAMIGLVNGKYYDINEPLPTFEEHLF